MPRWAVPVYRVWRGQGRGCEVKAKLKSWLKPLQVLVMIIGVSFLAGYWFTAGANHAGGLLHINVHFTE